MDEAEKKTWKEQTQHKDEYIYTDNGDGDDNPCVEAGELAKQKQERKRAKKAITTKWMRIYVGETNLH